MTDEGTLKRLAPLITQVTGVTPEDIKMTDVLMADLGAESIDLLDLSFLIEEEFGITIEADEFETQARERIPDGVYYRENGELTDAALVELRKLLPEIGQNRLVPGIRRTDLPSLLTVGVFVHLIQRKLALKAPGDPLKSPED